LSDGYFSSASFKFLRELARNNNRAWFNANKSRYDEQVKEPFLRLIGDLQAPLAKVSTHYRAEPRGLFRIYRDTRFANDKTPYKTWAGARLYHERRRETDAPSFYVHIQPGQCFVGAGLWRPEPASLKRIRDFLADNPKAWTAATRSAAFKKNYELGGETLTRPPRGYDPAHPLIEDIKRKSFTAWATFSDSEATSPQLAKLVASHVKGMAPLVDYLCAALDLEF
jgi:uncharacterized protein (TIGR02453 family)